MTTLFHAPLTCSLAARFAAAEGDVPLDISYLNLRTKELEAGGSLFDVNPLGQVAALQLGDGSLLTETSTVLLWIQSQSGNADFRVDPDDPDYFQLLRWIAFCATELHKGLFRVLFYQEATDKVKDRVRRLAPLRFKTLEQHLADRNYLLGERFTAADAYLTWFFVLSGKAQLDHGIYPNLESYRRRALSRPAIRDLIDQDRKKDREMGQGILPA
ncbi:glutathione binding-like protein [Denitrobaculum tricleocarpae]|uniref:Glutathione S-transferase n=1 Tax=Denitrobaculum tricleocarpae TaxID=2591009 RepID=A0A545TEN7_9PROT|nr:glutathione binding-like protein [Denitrobaculum tricleocarpae]TQV75687.1 hypothetical protein FKG95_22445 [Denitrobaculum tricleocarpae]